MRVVPRLCAFCDSTKIALKAISYPAWCVTIFSLFSFSTNRGNHGINNALACMNENVDPQVSGDSVAVLVFYCWAAAAP